MITYYARRVAEYERVYGSPRWQDDLEQICARIRAVFAGRRVLEVACGPGDGSSTPRFSSRFDARDMVPMTILLAAHAPRARAREQLPAR
jgi:demethylmenaquinone methyltransferase/2-methoxy-6-polyprenyl-1,4-benzoquinol methylase